MEFKQRLEIVNTRLRDEGYRLKILPNSTGNLLVVRGTFPPKPDSNKTKPYQQRLSLRLPANARGLKQAEKEAKWIAECLERNEFDWQKYLVKQEKSGKTVDDWTALYREQHFQQTLLLA